MWEKTERLLGWTSVRWTESSVFTLAVYVHDHVRSVLNYECMSRCPWSRGQRLPGILHSVQDRHAADLLQDSPCSRSNKRQLPPTRADRSGPMSGTERSQRIVACYHVLPLLIYCQYSASVSPTVGLGVVHMNHITHRTSVENRNPWLALHHFWLGHIKGMRWCTTHD